MRQGARFRNCNIYPTYEVILQIKYKCRVQELSVSETIAKVPLQNLLDHTTKRIVSLQQEVILCVLSHLMIIKLFVKLSIVTDLMEVLVKLHANRSLMVEVLNRIISYSQQQ